MSILINPVHFIAIILLIISRFLGNTIISYYLLLIGLNYAYGGFFIGRKLGRWQYVLCVWGGMAVVTLCGRFAYSYLL